MDRSKRLSVSAVYALADQGLVSATSLVTGIVIGRCCTRAEFGIYALGLSIVYALLNVQISLITSPFTVRSPRLPDLERAQYKGSTLIHQLAMSLAATGLLLAISLNAPRFGSVVAEMRQILWALAFTLPLMSLREYARQLSFAALKWRVALAFDVAVVSMQVTALLLLSRARLLTPARAFVTMGASCGVAGAFWLLGHRDSFAISFRRAALDFKWSWTFGKWILGGSLLLTLGTQIFPWALTAFHGAEATGLLAAALSTMSFSNPLLIGLQNITGPAAAHAYAQGGSSELRSLVTRTMAIAVTMVTLLVLAMCFYGDHVAVLLYGAKYAGSGILFTILALSTIPSALTSVATHGLRAIGRTEVGFKAQVCRTIVSITIGIWLVKNLGPVGASVGILLSGIVATAYEVFTFFYALRTPALLSSGGNANCPSTLA